jgi:hypothetical protein
MKQQLNEVKRMQQLAGIQINEVDGNSATYRSIGKDLISAMENMGYEHVMLPEGEYQSDWASAHSLFEFDKPIGEERSTRVFVYPAENSRTTPPNSRQADFSSIFIEMYIRIDTEREEKKLFGLRKAKVKDYEMEKVFDRVKLDLTKYNNKDAVSTITDFVKKGDSIANKKTK